MGEALGIVLAMMVNAFNFPLYLIAGGVIAGWDLFWTSMIAETRQEVVYLPHDGDEGGAGRVRE